MIEVTRKEYAFKVKVNGKIKKKTDDERAAEEFAGRTFDAGATLVEVIHTESNSVITTLTRK